MYVTTLPDRVATVEIQLWDHARIQVNQCKTQVRNRSGERPPIVTCFTELVAHRCVWRGDSGHPNKEYLAPFCFAQNSSKGSWPMESSWTGSRRCPIFKTSGSCCCSAQHPKQTSCGPSRAQFSVCQSPRRRAPSMFRVSVHIPVNQFLLPLFGSWTYSSLPQVPSLRARPVSSSVPRLDDPHPPAVFGSNTPSPQDGPQSSEVSSLLGLVQQLVELCRWNQSLISNLRDEVSQLRAQFASYLGSHTRLDSSQPPPPPPSPPIVPTMFLPVAQPGSAVHIAPVFAVRITRMDAVLVDVTQPSQIMCQWFLCLTLHECAVFVAPWTGPGWF